MDKYLILVLTMMLLSCGRGEVHSSLAESYYTCPMHPSVKSDSPGSCPVCNMSLVKVERGAEKGAHSASHITLSAHLQEVAGILTDTVSVHSIRPTSTLLGKVAIDEEQVRTISSRVEGRIDKLFVRANGIYVRKGAPLYSIYSEGLLADEKEYLSLVSKYSTAADSGLEARLLQASEAKLRLWGLSEDQLSELQASNHASPLVTYPSGESGYVTNVLVSQGDYVAEGGALIKMTPLRQVWVEAQLYSSELSEMKPGTDFSVYSESAPDIVYKGKLVYNNPVIEEGKRIYFIRLRVDNEDFSLRPGMMVSVVSRHAGTAVISVPRSAVLLEKMKTAWVKVDAITFEQRMVTTGLENGRWIEIVSGLAAGDVVVTDGAYLLSSELILKGGAIQAHVH